MSILEERILLPAFFEKTDHDEKRGKKPENIALSKKQISSPSLQNDYNKRNPAEKGDGIRLTT